MASLARPPRRSDVAGVVREKEEGAGPRPPGQCEYHLHDLPKRRQRPPEFRLIRQLCVRRAAGGRRGDAGPFHEAAQVAKGGREFCAERTRQRGEVLQSVQVSDVDVAADFGGELPACLAHFQSLLRRKWVVGRDSRRFVGTALVGLRSCWVERTTVMPLMFIAVPVKTKVTARTLPLCSHTSALS